MAYNIQYVATWQGSGNTSAANVKGMIVPWVDAMRNVLTEYSLDFTPSTTDGLSTLTGTGIYYLNDSLHATTPLYVKSIWTKAAYSTGNGFTWTVALGSSPTGPWGTAVNAAATGTSSTTAAVRIIDTSGEGYAGVFIPDSTVSTQEYCFMLSRPVNQTNSTVLSNGGFLYGVGADVRRYSKTYSAFSTYAQPTWAPNNSTSSNPSVALDVYRVWVELDGQMYCDPNLVAVHKAEHSFGRPFSVTPVTTSRTYMPINESNLDQSNLIYACRWD
jgi:hypothetical protein